MCIYICVYIYIYVSVCVGVWCRNISRQWFLASLVTINMITNGNKKMFLTSSVWRDYSKPARRNEESLPVTPPLWQSGGWLLRTNRMIYLKKNAKTKSFEGPRSLAIFKKRHTYGCVYVCIYIYIYIHTYIYIYIDSEISPFLSLKQIHMFWSSSLGVGTRQETNCWAQCFSCCLRPSRRMDMIIPAISPILIICI